MLRKRSSCDMKGVSSQRDRQREGSNKIRREIRRGTPGTNGRWFMFHPADRGFRTRRARARLSWSRSRRTASEQIRVGDSRCQGIRQCRLHDERRAHRHAGRSGSASDRPAGGSSDIVTQVRDGTLFIRWDGQRTRVSLRPAGCFRLSMENPFSPARGARLRHDESRDGSGAQAPFGSGLSSSGGVSMRLRAPTRWRREFPSAVVFAGGRDGGCPGRRARRARDSTRASGLASTTARIVASSSRQCDSTCRGEPRGDTSGAGGSVRYYGTPPRVDGNVTSSGRLVRLGD